MSPIGTLILEAEKSASKKASRAHRSVADCGCAVSVSWISSTSRLTDILRCSVHRIDRRKAR